jgi:hypothetical protein
MGHAAQLFLGRRRNPPGLGAQSAHAFTHLDHVAIGICGTAPC